MKRVALVVLVAATFAPTAAAEPAWEPATVVAPGIGKQEGIGSIWLLSGLDGHAVAGWDAFDCNPECSEKLFVSLRPALGAPWMAPTPFGSVSGVFYAADSNPRGDVVMAWWSGAELIVWSRAPGAEAWQRQVAAVRSSSLPVGEPTVAVGPTGAAVVAWGVAVECPAKCFYRLHAAVRAAGSSSWGPETELSSDTNRSGIGGKVAIDAAGNVVVVWVRVPIPGAPVVRAAFKPAGERWQPAVDVAKAEEDASIYGPSLAINATGDVLVAWSKIGRLGPGIFASYRAAGGSWPDAVQVSADAESPHVLLDEHGDGLLVWVTPSTTFSSSYTHALRRWSPETVVAEHGWSPIDFNRAESFALAPRGNAIAMWNEGTTLETALKPASSVAWSDPISVTTSYRRWGSVAFDANGHALALWGGPSAAGETIDVLASDLRGGPVITSLAVRRAVTAGARTRFSVDAFSWDAPLAGAPRWSFGDGKGASGAPVDHVYRRSGTYQATVTVGDAFGGVTTKTLVVHVATPMLRNTRLPSINGHARVGSILTCAPGSWRGAVKPHYSYGWFRDAVARAKGKRYRVVIGDSGHSLVCLVEASAFGATAGARSRAVHVP
jgi:hypothetical protein